MLLLRTPGMMRRPSRNCRQLFVGQLLPSNSIAIKLKDLAEKRFLFVQMGVSTFVGAPAVGIMPFLVVLDTVTAARIVDIAISTMALLGVSVPRRPWTYIHTCTDRYCLGRVSAEGMSKPRVKSALG